MKKRISKLELLARKFVEMEKNARLIPYDQTLSEWSAWRAAARLARQMNKQERKKVKK